MLMMSQVANALNSPLQGADTKITGVSKDSRDIKAGELYVALKGLNFNGHQFIEQAKNKGAKGFIVSQLIDDDVAQVKVKDTTLALGQLAKYWREQFKGKIIGITGSNGKTTVKEMCKKIIKDNTEKKSLLVTKGNLNNEIGVPITVLKIKKENQFAVIEMGASQVGDINYLTDITRPNIAILNNAGMAHLAGFSSLENVAITKAEIFNYLKKDDVAIINADDVFAKYWIKYCQEKSPLATIKTFSMKDNTATIFAEKINEESYQLHNENKKEILKINIPGKHNIMNSLVAILATNSLGISLASSIKSLSTFKNINGRLTIYETEIGGRVIDDSYNANPLSVMAAIDVLSSMAGNKVAIFGDMSELGESAKSLHYEIGLKAKQAEINTLYVTGKNSKYTAEGFGKNAFYFKNKQEMIQVLRERLSSKDVVLVKGSRSAVMEEVVEQILNQNNYNKRLN